MDSQPFQFFKLKFECDDKSPGSLILYQEALSNLIMTPAYIYCMCSILGLRKILDKNSQRYMYFNYFYMAIFLGLFSRVCYFLCLLLYFESEPNPKHERIFKTSCSLSRQFSGFGYYFFQNLTLMCMLFCTMMITRHWFTITQKFQEYQEVRMQNDRKFKIVSGVIFVTIIVSFVIFQSYQILVFVRTEHNNCNDEKYSNNLKLNMKRSYTGSKAILFFANFVICTYIGFYGKKMINFLHKIISSNEKKNEDNKLVRQWRNYKRNLYIIIAITFANILLYTCKTVLANIQSDTILAIESMLCQAGTWANLLFQVFQFGGLELAPLMIYCTFVKPQKKDIQEFYYNLRKLGKKGLEQSNLTEESSQSQSQQYNLNASNSGNNTSKENSKIQEGQSKGSRVQFKNDNSDIYNSDYQQSAGSSLKNQLLQQVDKKKKKSLHKSPGSFGEKKGSEFWIKEGDSGKNSFVEEDQQQQLQNYNDSKFQEDKNNLVGNSLMSEQMGGSRRKDSLYNSDNYMENSD